jgi:HEAT repeat protein
MAMRVLGKFGKKAEKAIATLEQALDDDDSEVREIAARSLRQIKDDAVQFEGGRR